MSALQTMRHKLSVYYVVMWFADPSTYDGHATHVHVAISQWLLVSTSKCFQNKYDVLFVTVYVTHTQPLKKCIVADALIPPFACNALHTLRHLLAALSMNRFVATRKQTSFLKLHCHPRIRHPTYDAPLPQGSSAGHVYHVCFYDTPSLHSSGNALSKTLPHEHARPLPGNLKTYHTLSLERKTSARIATWHRTHPNMLSNCYDATNNLKPACFPAQKLFRHVTLLFPGSLNFATTCKLLFNIHVKAAEKQNRSRSM